MVSLLPQGKTDLWMRRKFSLWMLLKQQTGNERSKTGNKSNRLLVLSNW